MKLGRPLSLLLAAAFSRFFLMNILTSTDNFWVKIMMIISILILGAAYVLQGTAKIIEETTEILSERTKLAGGVLQSLGTAFPDMALGIVAAVVSLRLRNSNYTQAISFAIIAAATTFGSNIYNIGHAIWCVLRQNLANKTGKVVQMFPLINNGGTVKPMRDHQILPSVRELDTAIDILNALTLLTAAVALSMVIFGKVTNQPPGVAGELYQLVKPAGAIIFALCILIIFLFRKAQRAKNPGEQIKEEETYYRRQPDLVIWLHLLASGGAILLAAESMVHAVMVFSETTGMPFVVAGVLAGMIGCLGEIMVVHNYSVNPKGKIGDALVGVSMDNIVTTLGAATVAIMGGIFLGGSALILIFVIILTLNSMLIWQISRLKNFFLNE